MTAKKILLRSALFSLLLLLAGIAVMAYNLASTATLFRADNGYLNTYRWQASAASLPLSGQWALMPDEFVHPLTFHDSLLERVRWYQSMPGTTAAFDDSVKLEKQATLFLVLDLPKAGRYQLRTPDWPFAYSLWVDKKHLVKNESVYQQDLPLQVTTGKVVEFEAKDMRASIIIHIRGQQGYTFWPSMSLERVGQGTASDWPQVTSYGLHQLLVVLSTAAVLCLLLLLMRGFYIAPVSLSAKVFIPAAGLIAVLIAGYVYLKPDTLIFIKWLYLGGLISLSAWLFVLHKAHNRLLASLALLSVLIVALHWLAFVDIRLNGLGDADSLLACVVLSVVFFFVGKTAKPVS